MGEALQIRVSAVTWNEDLLEKLWPRLSELAFSIPVRFEKHGVFDMVKALDEGLTFMDWSQARKEKMGPGIREAARLKKEIEDSLAAWDPRAANRLSDRLEATLEALEQNFTE